MTFLPAVLVTAGIAILSLTEGSQMPSVSLNDKVLHGATYFILALSWLIPVLQQRPTTSNHIKPCITVCACTTAYGALLEVLQHYCTLTRSGELSDLLADFLGALVGVAIIYLFDISRSRHLEITK